MTLPDDWLGAVNGGETDEADLSPGLEVGEHVIVGLLARGGCGAVYHARRRARGTLVASATAGTPGTPAALKVLHRRLAGLPKMVERFLREIEVVGLLRHPHIVSIHEFGVLPDQRPFFVMEYLDGGTLDDRVRQRGRLSVAEARAVLDPVCAALGAAHAAGVVHRDVKASNIAFHGATGEVKLLDFGIAKLLSPAAPQAGLTTVGRQIGTPAIMAPEQLRGEPVDERVDVYALGVLLYRLLTGRTPFEASTPAAVVRKHLEEPAPRPSQVAPVGPAVDAIVLRCLEKRPERRFESVAELAEALADAVDPSLGSVSSAGGGLAAAGVPACGVAIHVDLQLHTEGDDVDEALGEDLQLILDRAEERLLGAGFLLVQATGTGVLGVRPVRGGADELLPERRAALLAATALEVELAGRPTRDPRVQARIVVHAGEVLLRSASRLDLVGGALLRTSAWALPDARAGVLATAAATEGLSGWDESTRCDGLPESRRTPAAKPG